MNPSPQLTAENYLKGFLVDEELMAGVTADPENPSRFLAFVIEHASGEYLGNRTFESLDEALKVINEIPRNWKYDTANGGGCGSGQCGSGACGGGGCGGGGCEKADEGCCGGGCKA